MKGPTYEQIYEAVERYFPDSEILKPHVEKEEEEIED
jgi:hypothetical protein